MKNSVAGIAVESGKVFIARRVLGGDLGGKWEFPGGKIERGESGEQAMIREFGEELGVGVSVGEFLGSAEFEHRGKPHRVNAYRIEFASRDFTLTEHTEYRWAGIGEIESLVEAGEFAASDAKLLPYVKNIKI
jgi:8-oxo-dGTP diphosphatase